MKEQEDDENTEKLLYVKKIIEKDKLYQLEVKKKQKRYIKYQYKKKRFYYPNISKKDLE